MMIKPTHHVVDVNEFYWTVENARTCGNIHEVCGRTDLPGVIFENTSFGCCSCRSKTATELYALAFALIKELEEQLEVVS